MVLPHLRMDSLDCEICFYKFDEKERLPRTLPCGHTLCHACVHNSLKEGMLTCPSCRKPFYIKEASEVPINFTLLKVVDSLKTYSGAPAKSLHEGVSVLNTHLVQKPNIHAGICQEHGSLKLFWCRKCKVWICRDCTVINHPPDSCPVLSAKVALNTIKEKEKELLKVSTKSRYDHIDYLKERKNQLSLYDSKIGGQIEIIQRILNEMKDLRIMNKKEQNLIQSFLSEGNSFENKISNLEKVLNESQTVETLTNACKINQDYREELRNWVQITKEEVHSLSTPQLCEKQHARLGIILQMTDYWENRLFLPIGTAMLSYMKSKISEDHLTKHDLKVLSSLAPVWAVQSDSKCSPVTISGENILLHALRQGSPPKGAVILPFNEILALEKNLPQVFLEFSCNGAKRGTTYIQMEDLSAAGETSGKATFFQLCTGEGGNSFISHNTIQIEENDGIYEGQRLCWGVDGHAVIVEEIASHELNISNGYVTCSLSDNSLCFSVWFNCPQYSGEVQRGYFKPFHGGRPQINDRNLHPFRRKHLFNAERYASRAYPQVDMYETLGVVTENLQMIEEVAQDLYSVNNVHISDSGLVIKGY